MKARHIFAIGLLAVGVWWVVNQFVTFKPGVPSDTLQWPARLALNIAAAIRAALGGGSTTVTATTNGAHMATSLHYQGMAIDLRAHDLAVALQQKWYELVKASLSIFGFDVLLEDAGTANAHIHVEYDPEGSRILG